MSAEDQSLIDQYRAVSNKGTLVRLTVVFLLIAVVVVQISVMWNSFTEFRMRHVPDFAAELSAQMSTQTPQMSEDVAAMLERVAPVYGEALERRYQDAKPELQLEVSRQLRKLDAYAQERWPDIEQQITDLALSQEILIHDHLMDVVDADDAEEISALYGAALTDKFTQVLKTDLKGHVEVAEGIGENLNNLVAQVPPPEEPVEVQDIVGIAMELAGLQLQDSSY